MQFVNPTTGIPWSIAFVTHGTSGETMANGFQASCHTATGVMTVKAPRAPLDAFSFAVVDVDGAASALQPIIVDGNGFNIDGSPTVNLTTAFARATYVFDGTEWTSVGGTLRKYDGESPTMPDRSGLVPTGGGAGSGGGGALPNPPDGSIQIANGVVFGSFGLYDPTFKNLLLDSTCSVISPGATTVNALAGGAHSSVGDAIDMTGQFAFAYGDTCAARGDYAFATGFHTNARGQSSIAMGFGSLVSGQGAIGIGFGPIAVGAVACAFGDGAQANGVGALGLTEDNVADADHTTAMGEGSHAIRYGQIASVALSTDNPFGHARDFLFLALVAGGGAQPLKLHDGTEIVVPNQFRGFMEINVTASDQVVNDHSAWKYLVAFHCQATVLTLDLQTPLIAFNPLGYALTFSTTLNTLHINIDPGAFTVNATADVEWHITKGIL